MVNLAAERRYLMETGSQHKKLSFITSYANKLLNMEFGPLRLFNVPAKSSFVEYYYFLKIRTYETFVIDSQPMRMQISLLCL